MKIDMLKSKKGMIIILPIIAFVVIVLFALQIDTDSLISQTKAAFLSSDYYVDEEFYNDHPENYTNSKINYILYNRDEQRYDIQKWFNMSRNVSIDEAEGVTVIIDIHRLYTLHNFFDGYIWFYYDVEYLDKNGNHLSGAITTPFHPVKMQIHKENGEWQVIRIWERP